MIKVRDWLLGVLALCMLAVMCVLGAQSAGGNPATGETTVLWPVFMLLALSGAGLVIMLVLKKKTRK